ncbi:MAG: hypothetical protein JXA06_11555 [Bacteroidetes bacterium]|nr:hypothetical protein [Bacteroidota bacterium]
MTDNWIFDFLQDATKPQNLILTILVGLLATALATYIIYKTIHAMSWKMFFLTHLISFLLCFILYQTAKGYVHGIQLETITNVFTELDNRTTLESDPYVRTKFDSWEKGLEIILAHPAEVEPYLQTADIFERIGHLEAALMLVENGFDFVEGTPIAMCERLQRYYRDLKLTNRPRLVGCDKFIQIQ